MGNLIDRAQPHSPLGECAQIIAIYREAKSHEHPPTHSQTPLPLSGN
ncbi:hypothetical protein OSCI_1600017 [Kamptonema sp. PCC 6506]|nr:hypothetical protein OSCI_1600017 [Kamptonema sp. PCC 6506]